MGTNKNSYKDTIFSTLICLDILFVSVIFSLIFLCSVYIILNFTCTMSPTDGKYSNE